VGKITESCQLFCSLDETQESSGKPSRNDGMPYRVRVVNLYSVLTQSYSTLMIMIIHLYNITYSKRFTIYMFKTDGLLL
jgi:hypothetical protein